jgi:hypothetical protein
MSSKTAAPTRVVLDSRNLWLQAMLSSPGGRLELVERRASICVRSQRYSWRRDEHRGRDRVLRRRLPSLRLAAPRSHRRRAPLVASSLPLSSAPPLPKRTGVPKPDFPYCATPACIAQEHSHIHAFLPIYSYITQPLQPISLLHLAIQISLITNTLASPHALPPRRTWTRPASGSAPG